MKKENGGFLFQSTHRTHFTLLERKKVHYRLHLTLLSLFTTLHQNRSWFHPIKRIFGRSCDHDFAVILSLTKLPILQLSNNSEATSPPRAIGRIFLWWSGGVLPPGLSGYYLRLNDSVDYLYQRLNCLSISILCFSKSLGSVFTLATNFVNTFIKHNRFMSVMLSKMF